MHKRSLWSGTILTATLPGMFIAAWAASPAAVRTARGKSRGWIAVGPA
jgi:hypothetical protein